MRREQSESPRTDGDGGAPEHPVAPQSSAGRAEPTAADRASARVGTRLNAKWTLDAMLGVGGMATVYAATHRNGSRAALKVLHAELAREDDVRERFLREARIANALDHPSCVRVTDDDTSDTGEPFLVMELLEGTTLESLLAARGGRLDLEETLRILDPIVDLLGRAHERQIVHRDVKPANIFVTHDGAIKLLDFGIARLREGRAQANATRQGTALGTPSFMAPEQALGLGDLIDGRADLWSVGACMFTCLTGRRLHDARTENEAFILAATKAAPSIATVAPELPVEVVALVDKALAQDRHHRFQDARSMRAEMSALQAALRAGRLTSSEPKKQAGVVLKGSDDADETAPLSAEAKARATDQLQSAWKLLAMFMAGVRQYGWQHPEPARHLRAAFDTLVEMLAAGTAVRWEVTPYAFVYEGAAVWEPDRAPFDRVPFQLFGDGLRRVQIGAGVTEQELRDLLAILMRDPTASSGTEDDSVTGFWDRHFEHVSYVAIDSFAEGDADDRAKFDDDCDTVAREAAKVAHLEKDWDDGSLEARALEKNLDGARREAADAAAAIAVDLPTRATLAAQVALSTEMWTERFVDAFAHARRHAPKPDDAVVLGTALAEWTGDQVSLHNYALAFAMFGSLEKAMGARDAERAPELERWLSSHMFPARVLAPMIERTAGDLRLAEGKGGGAVDATVAAGLTRALGLLENDALFDVACDALDAPLGDELAAGLLAYLTRWAPGHEAELGARAGRARQDLALKLVRLLASMGTAAAHQAIAQALHSPHVEVRMEALMALPGVSDEGTARELQKLLDDREANVRREALRVIAKLRVKAVGPALVTRIQSETFSSYGVAERKQWLVTLAALHPARAEALAIELLGRWKVLPNAASEGTRIAAVEALSASRSREAFDVVLAASKKRWWNSADLRAAATRVSGEIGRRLGLEVPAADPEPTSDRGER